VFAYFARRLVYAVITVILISIIGFVIIEISPGSYLDVKINQLAQTGTYTNDEMVQALKQQYGLDKSPVERYTMWAWGFLHGNFGDSFTYNLPVSDLLWDRLGFTVILSVVSLLLTWLIAIPIGIYSATHQYPAGDNIATLIGLAGISIPNFSLALVLMVMMARGFGQEVGGLYSQAYMDAPMSWLKLVDLAKHLWIPLVVVAFGGLAGLMRMMRGNLLDVLNMQYIQAARARGLSETKVIVKHGVRNAVQPLIMLLGMSLPNIISGATVISIVLNLPTVGPIYFRALLDRDMYLSVTFLVFLGIMLVIGNLLADMLLAWVDPRIRYE
jgi:peptide/nickel transport system permease protein